MAINAQVAVEKLMAWKPNSIQASQHALGQKQSGLLIVRIVACKTKLTQVLANLALNFGTNAWHASMNSRFAQEPNCSRKTLMAKRKIIQIQALRLNEWQGEDEAPKQETELVALCDDGSVWTMTGVQYGAEWVRAADIPQTDE